MRQKGNRERGGKVFKIKQTKGGKQQEKTVNTYGREREEEAEEEKLPKSNKRRKVNNRRKQ